MPFLDAHIRWMICSQRCRGRCEDSKTVPMRTVNGWRHSLQLYRPRRVVSPCILVMRLASALPQCGQFGPSGHNTLSTCAKADSSLWKWMASRMGRAMEVEPLKLGEYPTDEQVAIGRLVALAWSDGLSAGIRASSCEHEPAPCQSSESKRPRRGLRGYLRERLGILGFR